MSNIELRDHVRPYPAELIEQRQVGGGRMEDYVTWSNVAQRLLATHGPYSWGVEHIVPPQIPDAEWVVAGSIWLTVDGETNHYSGIGQGRDAKAAESDAFKRAAGKSGCGLHLWAKQWFLEAQLDANQ